MVGASFLCRGIYTSSLLEEIELEINELDMAQILSSTLSIEVHISTSIVVAALELITASAPTSVRIVGSTA